MFVAAMMITIDYFNVNTVKLHFVTHIVTLGSMETQHFLKEVGIVSAVRRS